jgi:antitoxin HicB
VPNCATARIARADLCSRDRFGAGEERPLGLAAERLLTISPREVALSPSEMARWMRMSREAVYRLLDPTRTGVMLDSLQRAASALGLTLNISFEAPPRRSADARSHGLGSRRKKRAA